MNSHTSATNQDDQTRRRQVESTRQQARTRFALMRAAVADRQREARTEEPADPLRDFWRQPR